MELRGKAEDGKAEDINAFDCNNNRDMMKAREFVKICEGSAGKLLKEYLDTSKKNAKNLDEIYKYIKKAPELFPNAPYKQINGIGRFVMFAAYPFLYANEGLMSFPDAMFNYAKKSLKQASKPI